MSIDNFSEKIVNLYQLIQNEFDKKRMIFIEEGYHDQTRISYEYIDLDNIFDELIEVMPLILDLYREKRFQHIIREMHCVFIAALCEISKRGFSQGGILKQIDEYIGFEFNRNSYYRLIKNALKSENIKVFNGVWHPYEATIVYESGIPKKFHKDLFQLFKIYWKWMRGIDPKERWDFLREFIEKRVVCEEYVFDKNDYQKMCFLRNNMIDFQEKVIKTCIRIDKIYSEIDKIQRVINENNINEICRNISEQLGYNILTVISEMTLKRDLIDYAHCIGFSKFQKILENVLPDEKIVIPTGQIVTSSQYSISNYICGYHRVRQVTYEVVFPYGLKCKDYFELPREKVIERNEHYIYISEYPFQVEIDGYNVNTRELVWNNEMLHVFAGKIPSASSAYIDGNIIHCIEDVKLKASVRKSWDSIERRNKLILCIDEVKVFNPQYAMQTIEIACNISDETIVRQINSRGHQRIIEKWIEFKKLPEHIEVDVKINGEIITSKNIDISPLYVYSLQTGNRVQDKIEWKDWHSDNRIVIFSKNPIEISNVELTFQGMFYDMFVYLGNFNFLLDYIKLNNTIIEIKKSNIPMIKLSSEVIYCNNYLCVPPGAPIKFSALNCTSEGLFLKISHGQESYKGKLLSELDDLDNIYISNCGVYTKDNYGTWVVSLYQEQEQVCSISFFVLTEIEVQLEKEVYRDTENVIARLEARNKCFSIDGEITDICEMQVGKAQICIDGNHVNSKIIEFEVSDANCDIQYQLKVKPEVWGVYAQVNGEWIESPKKIIQLDLSSNASISLIICSTMEQKVVINSQESKIPFYINSGFTHVSWRYLKDRWHRINNFVVCNHMGDEIAFQIIYEPHIYYKGSFYSKDIFIMNFYYKGPIGTRLNLVAYANGTKIGKLSRAADYSKFGMKLIIDNIKDFWDKTLVIQSRIDDDDPNEICTMPINFKVIEEYEEENKTIISKELIQNKINLSKYLITLEILQSSKRESPRELKVLNILDYLKEVRI